MKKFQFQLNHLVLITLITGTCLFLLSPVLNAGVSEGEKTIVDYYLQIPYSYFHCETDSLLKQSDKLALIKKKNIKKGYIHASTVDGGFPLETALFTDDYMGIKVLAVNVRCKTGCMCRKLDLFFVSDGKLMKSGNDFIFPKIGDIEKAAGRDSDYEFVLPEDGSGINVVDELSGKVLLKIEWSGGTFNIE